MAINASKLKGKIIECGTTQDAVARAIGMNRSTFYRKMRKDSKGFSIEDAQKMIKSIPLTTDEAIQIFLPH